jgi:3-isopropylmalate/(R)-2-methylmalate dehydratase small subunit
MAEPVRQITGVAAALRIENVDTDMIWPATPGASLMRGAQAGQVFRRLRFSSDGQENPDFVLNKQPWRQATILLAGDNFGCGSSREMAVWALYEWGIRCIIAPRFGDIFYGNCVINGLLPIQLPRATVESLMALADQPASPEFVVDLELQTILVVDHETRFEIDRRTREALLSGRDQIEITLESMKDISRFGSEYLRRFPWVDDNAQDTSA